MRITIVFLFGIAALGGQVLADLPADVRLTPEAEAYRERMKPIREAARERMRNSISLEEDVAAYLEFRSQSLGVSFSKVIETYGREPALREQVKQIKEHPEYRGLMGGLLLSAKSDRYEFLRDAALEFLDRTHNAVSWCLANWDMLDEAQQQRVQESVRTRFIESGGTHGLEFVRQFGTPEDLALIRRVYHQRYSGERRDSGFSCAHAVRAYGASRGDLLLAMHSLGETRFPLNEVREAIRQEQDVQRRMWGLIMAGQMKERRLVPLIVPLLDDTRHSQEVVAEGGEPGRFIWRAMYTRVCDVAVRPLHEIEQPEERWPFPVPRTEVWWLGHGGVEYFFPHVVDKGIGEVEEQLAQRHRRTMIVGFTDEQIDFVRQRFRQGR